MILFKTIFINRFVVKILIFIISFSAYAEISKQEKISQYQQVVISSQQKKNCEKVIQYMELLNELTQDIPSALFYFQASCYYQQQQFSKLPPILDRYFFHALHNDKYFNQALKLYSRSEEKRSISSSKQKEYLSMPSDKLQQIKMKTGLEFVKVKAGCFTMGSPLDEPERVGDEVRHKVCLTRSYLLGKYEVTQGQWEAVMGKTPSHFKDCGSRCPVESISRKDIRAFIEILQIKTGFRFRLPTEAEWEYAARAGTETPFSFGENINTSQVNYDGDHPYVGDQVGRDRKSPIAVGSLPANPWGFYDMHGNVWESVQDWHNIDYYKNSPMNNPKGPAKGSFYVRRGGSWRFGARFCRSAYRGRFRADSTSKLLGVRLALTL